MQQGREILQLQGRLAPAGILLQLRAPPAHHLGVKFGAAGVIVDSAGSLEVVGQGFVKFAKAKGSISTIVLHGTLGTDPVACPDFLAAIFGLYKQNKLMFRMGRRNDSNCMGFVKAGKVVKIAVLAEGILNVVVHNGQIGSRDKRHTRPQFVHECLSPCRCFCHAT